MRLKVLTTTVLLLLLSALTLFGVRAIRNEGARYRQDLSLFYESRLQRITEALDRAVGQFESDLLVEMLEIDLGDQEALRRLSRESGRIRQLFLLDDGGDVLFPPLEEPGAGEEAFFHRADFLLDAGGQFILLPEAPSADRGWYLYYEADTTAYLFWYRLEDGNIIGADIFREALFSDLYLVLSELYEEQEAGVLIRVRDELGRDLFLSGEADPDPDTASPFLSAFVGSPLQGWRVDAFLSRERVSPPGMMWNILLPGIGLILALGISGILLFREAGREIREAGRRVGFVSRISHELKSPITNIRLYGELVMRKGEDEKVRHYGEVILSESERLSRMVNNVLTFSGKEKPLRLGAVNLQELLEEMGARSDLELLFKSMVSGELLLDRDVVYQILVNLISNAEKYAAAGGQIRVESYLEDGNGPMLHLLFRDYGPGIPVSKRKAVFTPFYRIRNDLTEGVSGSGLGLSIARELARRHGGDLRIDPVEGGNGTLFHLVIKPGEKHEDTDSRG